MPFCRIQCQSSSLCCLCSLCACAFITGAGPNFAGSTANLRISDVCAVCAVYAFSTGAGSTFAGYNANRRVSAVSAVCVFYAFGAGAGPIFRDPILQPTHRSNAIVLPIAEPSLGTCILQSSRSLPAESLQTGAASAARASADVVDARIRARWWQSLVPNGLAVSIARERDIVWRLPRDEPQSLAEWRQHCEQAIRSISRSYVFYIGITDNPAHRWQMHSHSGVGWSTMFVIAVAASSRTTGQLERHLIDMFRNPLTCTNIGRGAECSSYGSPHFVYTVFRTDGLLRRSGQGSRSRSSRMESFSEFLEASRRGF